MLQIREQENIPRAVSGNSGELSKYLDNLTIQLFAHYQHIPATRASHLQAKDNEHRGEGPGGGQDRGDPPAQGTGRDQGVRTADHQGEESGRGDGPDGAADCSVKARL